MICRECGREVSLDHKYLRTIARRLLKDYKFRAELDHLAIFGLCQACDEKRTASPD